MANDSSSRLEPETLRITRRQTHQRSNSARSNDGTTRNNNQQRLRHSGEEIASSRNDPVQLGHQPHRHRRRKRGTSVTQIEALSRAPTTGKEHTESIRRRPSVATSTARRNVHSTRERVRRTGQQESTARRSTRPSEPQRPPSSSESDGENWQDSSRAEETITSRHTSQPRRSSSTRETLARPSLVRISHSTRQPTRATVLPTVNEESRSQAHPPMQRSLSVFGNLFGPARPTVPEEIVSCLTCMDDVAASRAPLLTCGHRMCHSCLRRIFTLSVTDPAHMPPKCCTDECIPIKYVQKLFDDRFKIRWNKKYHEYTTKNRIYCPTKGCGSWIPPKDISRDKTGGRKYGTCRKCKTQVCAACNGKRHKSKECPKDDTTQQFAEMAKDNGWQKCYNCSATVELKEGCNHMTCRCTAQFCMICGEKWKTCDCPWFNYTGGAGILFGNMNIPQAREEIARGGNAFAQPMAYAEEMQRRREQERQDEEFARRLQQMDIGLRLPRGGFGVGNMIEQFLEPAFVQRAADILTAGANIVHRETVASAEQPIRANQRVFGAAAAFALPTPNPFRRPVYPRRNASAPVQGISEDLPDPPPAYGPPRPTIAENPQPRPQPQSQPQRSATVRSARRPQPVVNTSTTQNKVKETFERSSMLAGLHRASTTSRVAAWREHVTGYPPVSPT